MSESKHTPFPWDYVGDHIVGVYGACRCETEVHERDESGETLVCYSDYQHESHEVVPPITEDDLPEGVTMEEHIANCTMIGALPELLITLEAITAIDPWKRGSYARFKELQDRARKIVAKAKGQQ